MTTGQFIKEQRLKMGLTQEELASKTDLTARTIQRIENNEVVPRPFTLQAIATALSIDFTLLNKGNLSIEKEENNDTIWFALIHLSGLCFLLIPPLVIWYFKKDELKGIKSHAVSVINFQINVLACIIPCGIFAIFMFPIVILIGISIIGSVIIIINSIKAFNNQSYRYPLMFKILTV
jgi:transcriptional regulator with XRE-family HTH domain